MPAASAAGIFPRDPRRPSYTEEFAEASFPRNHPHRRLLGAVASSRRHVQKSGRLSFLRRSRPGRRPSLSPPPGGAAERCGRCLLRSAAAWKAPPMLIARSRSKISPRRMRFLWEGASPGPGRYQAGRSGCLKRVGCRAAPRRHPAPAAGGNSAGSNLESWR